MNATDSTLPLKRIEALSDGIFAIAMTLLVLNIHVPDGDLVRQIGLHKALLKHSDQFYSYFLSFFLLGIFWMIQHKQMNVLVRTNQTHMWINIILLMFICLIPFSSSLQSEYGDQTNSALFFNCNMIIISIFFLISWLYATGKKRLVPEDYDEKRVKTGIWNVTIFMFICFLALIASSFIPSYSGMIYLLIPVLKALTHKKRVTA